MPIDIENLGKGVKFPYPLEGCDGDEKGEPKEWVKVRIYTDAAMTNIDKATTERRREFIQPKKESGKVDRRAALQPVEFRETTKPQERKEMMWEFLIEDWCLYDLSGKKISCTKSMKIKLMSEDTEFAVYIADCLDLLDTERTAKKERLRKNL